MTGTRALIPALLSFRGVCAFWIAYSLVHAGFRLAVSPTLSRDDNAASVLAQDLALGYIRQPPLYEWLLWLSQQIFGTGIASNLAVRYALIAALGLATFGATRAAAKDERIAALASLSLVFSYQVGWTFHEWGTHTLLLSIACVASVHAAIRFFERAGGGRAVLLGFALALGLYSKFNYVLLPAGLLLAALSLRELRPRLIDARLVISVALALVLFTPYLYWLAGMKGDIVALAASQLITIDAPHWERALYGLWRLVITLVLFLMPWLPLVVMLAGGAFVRPPAGAPAAGVVERLVLRTMILAAILLAAVIAATGATNIRLGYMHPILIVAPVYVFARIARLGLSEDRARRFVVFAVAMAILALGCRFLSVTDNIFTRGRSFNVLIPYAGLAEALERRGITDGTLVSPDERDAANLRAFLPNLRVVAGSLRLERPARRPSDERSCVLVWARGQDSAAQQLAPIETLVVERIEIAARPSRFLAARGGTWFLARLDPKLPVCS